MYDSICFTSTLVIVLARFEHQRGQTGERNWTNHVLLWSEILCFRSLQISRGIYKVSIIIDAALSTFSDIDCFCAGINFSYKSNKTSNCPAWPSLMSLPHNSWRSSYNVIWMSDALWCAAITMFFVFIFSYSWTRWLRPSHSSAWLCLGISTHCRPISRLWTQSMRSSQKVNVSLRWVQSLHFKRCFLFTCQSIDISGGGHSSLFSGQIPAAVELQFLEKIKWLDLYGCELHPVIVSFMTCRNAFIVMQTITPLQAEDANEYFIGLNPHGVIVLKNKLKVANYFW